MYKNSRDATKRMINQSNLKIIDHFLRCTQICARMRTLKTNTRLIGEKISFVKIVIETAVIKLALRCNFSIRMTGLYFWSQLLDMTKVKVF